MTTLDGVRLVARRELVERTRDRSFLISTAVTLLILSAFIVVPKVFLSNRTPTWDVGLVGGGSAALGGPLQTQAPLVGAKVRIRHPADVPAAEAALHHRDLDLQLLIVGGFGLGVAVAIDAVDLPPGAFATIGLVLAWFLLGYSFYSVLFAVAGAVVSRQEELQNSATPLNLVLVASFLAAISALGNPNGAIAKVASFLPPVAPLTMPVRVAGGDAAGWEIVASVLITLAAIAVLVPLAARLYAGAVLRTGARVKLRAAWTASRG